jgi:hypothetical protein
MRGMGRFVGKRMSPEKVLSLLVESGFIYSLLWVRNNSLSVKI